MNRYLDDIRHTFARAARRKIPGAQSELLSIFLAGAIVGVLAGAAAAMLVTPRTGRDLRRQLSDRVKQLKGRASETAERMRHEVEQLGGHKAEPYNRPNVPMG
jgi:hypothetical protein